MKSLINQQMNFSDVVIILALSVLGGGAFFLIEILLVALPPLSLVTLRMGIASLALWVIVLILKTPIPTSVPHWRAMCIIGLLNIAWPHFLISWGQTQIGAGLASIMASTAPFFTIAVAGFALSDEKITLPKICGASVGLFGIFISVGPVTIYGLNGPILGQIAVLMAALSYAFAGVYARRFKERGTSPLMIATGQVTTATLMLLPVTILVDPIEPILNLEKSTIIAMACLTIFSTVIAYVLYFRLIESAGATNASLIAFLVPVSAILLSTVFLGETFSLTDFSVIAIIMLGLLIIDGRVLKMFFHK